MPVLMKNGITTVVFTPGAAERSSVRRVSPKPYAACLLTV